MSLPTESSFCRLCTSEMVEHACRVSDDDLLIALLSGTVPGSSRAAALVGQLLAGAPDAVVPAHSPLLHWVTGPSCCWSNHDDPLTHLWSMAVPASANSLYSQLDSLRQLSVSSADTNAGLSVLEEWQSRVCWWNATHV